MAVVETKNLKKHFHEVRAVDGVDLACEEGELLVLLGPSGCGKTTLMRMIAGLETPTEGQVLIDNEVVNELPPRARQIAMVFQSYALYPHMSVFDNIAFPLKAQRTPMEERKRKVHEAAAMLGIDGLLKRRPRQLSGGERQRVALARAMVRDPKVMLLDEPLSNLDAKLRASARDELQRFQRRMGITTVFVTHDQIEAMGLGDRIAVMYEGRVRQIGTPEQIYNDSADTFVATFLGSPGMNLLEKEDTLIGFRPEHFLPAGTTGPEAETASFTFEIDRVEYLGADRLIYGGVDGAHAETKIVARLPQTVTLTVHGGESHMFEVQRKDLRFFDRKTGERTEPHMEAV